ncbi:MAG: methyltransferase [Acidimicrobiales bacterium]
MADPLAPEAPRPVTCRFGPLDVTYDQRVLVPRPWTLAQSRWAAALVTGCGPGRLLELCAGVGHIGLAAAVLAERGLVQVELDPVAAGYARANAERAGWAARVEVRIGPLAGAIEAHERFPLVIADPPYLPTVDIGRFPEDPRLAIDGGADGLDVVRACLSVAGRHLQAGGALILQVAGPGQARAVEALVAARPVGALQPVDTRVVNQERALVLLRQAGTPAVPAGRAGHPGGPTPPP